MKRSILNELKLTLQSHGELNSELWTDNLKLDPSVWRALDRIGKEWAEFASIPKKAIKDVILTGGNANYNYTKYSDIDLHLVIDKEQIDCPDVLDDYLQSKKQLWALTHDITVKGQLLNFMLRTTKTRSVRVKVSTLSSLTSGCRSLPSIRLTETILKLSGRLRTL